MNCINCGKESGEKIYCSHTCEAETNKKAVPSAKCLFCGEIIKGHKIFCNYFCEQMWYKRQREKQ
jgi:hypothetical protein